MFKKSLEDTAIIEAIKMGSDKVLFKLYDSMKKPFVSWLLNNHNINKEDAEDIFQDTIITFYYNVKDEKFNASYATVKTYIFSIGKNIARNHLRKRKELLIDHTELNITESVTESDPRVDVIKKYILQMGEKCREVLLLYYEKEFSMESIAINMGYKNAGVAKKKKHECMKKLENAMIPILNSKTYDIR